MRKADYWFVFVAVGRVIIELRKDVAPLTVENFRCLCTGEKGIGVNGKPLHYKGIKFHKVQRLFMVQGGDVVKNDGSSGESIYGPFFDDETLKLPVGITQNTLKLALLILSIYFHPQHEVGSVGMANFGRPNTNNSQFFVTTVDSPHCDGSNVVFAKVLRGLGCFQEMEKFTSDESVPLLVGYSLIIVFYYNPMKNSVRFDFICQKKIFFFKCQFDDRKWRFRTAVRFCRVKIGIFVMMIKAAKSYHHSQKTGIKRRRNSRYLPTKISIGIKIILKAFPFLFIDWRSCASSWND